MEDPVLLDPALRAPTPESRMVSADGKTIDLPGLVVMPTWREFLVDLVKSEQMDPWDIDLIKITDAYLKQIKKLQAMDLRVPANVILAAALLLRFKSDALQLEEPEPEEYYEEPALIAEDIPELVFRPNRPRARRMTLDELLAAVEDVMSKGGGQPRLSIPAPRILTLELPKMDMNERMLDVYQLSHSLKDQENVLFFGQLLEASLQRESHADLSITEAISWHLLPILHLVQERKMLAWQDYHFGEVFLKVLTEAEQEAHAKAAAQSEDDEEKTIMTRARALSEKAKVGAVKAKATREAKKAAQAQEAAKVEEEFATDVQANDGWGDELTAEGGKAANPNEQNPGETQVEAVTKPDEPQNPAV